MPSVAGNSTFRGIVFCHLCTPKTVISNFITMRQIETPYLSPCMVTRTFFLVDKKPLGRKKKKASL
jgi:hypothetical protein